jgi:ABC-type transport system involved in multi-copper enzyme maturation permease subunit
LSIVRAFLTADCVSGEKRDGTLGLLFLTDLESYDVVFGKMAATSLHAVYGLLCVLPSLALCLLLGGVTMGEFWRTTAVLVVTMFMSLTIGLATSVLSREARQAMIGTMGILVGLAGGPPLLWWLGKNFLPSAGAFTDLLLLASPPFDLAFASDMSYNAGWGPWFFWRALMVQTAIGGGGVILRGPMGAARLERRTRGFGPTNNAVGTLAPAGQSSHAKTSALFN